MSKNVNWEAIYKATDNDFVEDLNGSRLIYTKDFYIALHKKLEAGMGAVEAYKSLGFDVNALGKERAYAAAQRAKAMEIDDMYTIDPSNYDGSATREMMGDLTPQEELAYLKARNIYLEELVELQKKMPSELEEIITSLTNEKKI
ncbi:MAG: hypothetical protein UIM26_04680 [Longicatena sp.]|nr:hypothetical protein [Longicatena sp.]